MARLLRLLPSMLLVLLCCAADAAGAACRTDLDCSLNGVCAAGSCACDGGWRGAGCELLDLRPAPPGGAYGFAPNISAWGAHVIKAPADELYHMFVSEFWGGCGVSESWQADSHVVHATAATPLGPYVQ